MTTTNKFPFILHPLTAQGIDVVTRADSPFSVESKFVPFGESIEITETVYSANLDRAGLCWMDLDGDSQRARFGSVRWGRGPVPEWVEDQANAARLRALEAERAHLIRSNPRLAKSTGAALRVAALDAAIEGRSA